MGILGTPWDHHQGNSLIFRGMGGQEKKRVFSDFGLNLLVHRKFPRAESGKFFVSTPSSKDILFLLCNIFFLTTLLVCFRFAQETVSFHSPLKVAPYVEATSEK